MNRRNIEAQIVDKAQTDPAFRRALLANPTATIARDFNVQFPPGVHLRVVEKTARELFLVLPVPPADAPLDDRELDAVAGGRGMNLTASMDKKWEQTRTVIDNRS